MPILGTVASGYNLPPSVVTGGTLTDDGTYYYRTFTASGSLTVSNATLTADVFILGGGGGRGGGSGTYGGGGGSGGAAYFTNYSIATNTYSIVIGAFGASGASGSNSTGLGVTAYGGGKGGNYGGLNASTGGSGGGGIYQPAGGDQPGADATQATGAPSGATLLGNSGGGSSSPGRIDGGGGGGLGTSGGGGYNDVPYDSYRAVGGAGGNGTTIISSWLATVGLGQLSSGSYYIGAGGGGWGDNSGNNGLGIGANTGSGGSYGGITAASDGVIIIRYLKSAV